MTGMEGRIFTYICAEAETDTVKRMTKKNNNLTKLFFMIKIFGLIKKMIAQPKFNLTGF
jgi:hypothetical protein